MSELTKNALDSIEAAVKIILSSKYVVALVGAGISVESGIPPFRGPGGIWTKYGEPGMDGFQRFLDNPKKWWTDRLHPRDDWRIQHHNVLAQAQPNSGHFALVELEEIGVLKSIITQNVDNLHFKAGSKNVIEIHGNAFKLRCLRCNERFDQDTFQVKDLPPRCPRCGGIVKTDSVMFGEPIPQDVLIKCYAEIEKCDCMMLVGTSGVVYPAASFPKAVKSNRGVLIEVNPYETALTSACDIVIRAPSGKALPVLVNRIKMSRG